MLRFARLQLRDRAVAEEVVQETWLRVVRGIDDFEGRSSLRAWVFVILANCARRRGEREGRSIPFASLDLDSRTPVDEGSFFPTDHPRWAGMWTTLVSCWDEFPSEVLASAELQARVSEAIDALPPNQATVFTLRDVEGWGSGDVCSLLEISAENQRVILHRARTRVRAALEEYLEGEAR